jgi:peptidyl-prolyl cis-trans isomerase C
VTEDFASPYLALKLAREFYGKSTEALDQAERHRVTTLARRQAEIENRILATVEASSVMLPESSVAGGLAEIRQRYPGPDEYEADLARAGLTHESLCAALERDLKVEAVLEQVAHRAPPVSATDIEIFFLQHAERFVKAESRTLRHVLVTINDTLPGNERAAAYEKIAAVQSRLLKEPQRFAEQALKHSECPTAMNGGLLGQVPRGKLYPEIDAVAFALPEGGLSDIVESPLGFHLVLCERIEPERRVTLDETRERIRDRLETERQRGFQKAWIAALLQPPA